ncbi:cytochrome P450 [Pseudovirgaria hyperparasitica]|uniref:Cytochrome P450 n=1 Tax=Pseudovirgaria hyperparasitica TaxID=470096 RepID=A0A6A6WC78_9PEZI|nr:cytochrome P450 [Pseudovirgaria hyperparasitica]KAF2760438.1 cytochrome P450 [Pseudovirgaria hyperparasitica]
MKAWLDDIPNEGLIYYRSAFNAERLLPTTPKAIGEVLVSKSYEFIKPKQIREGLGRLLGIGVLLAEGDEHRRQRKLLMPAFQFRHIKDLYPVFWMKSAEMVTALSKTNSVPNASGTSPIISIIDWVSRCTLDIIGVAGMGQDFDAIQNPDGDLSTTYRTISSPSSATRILNVIAIVVPMWILRRLPIKRNEDMIHAIRTIKSTSRNLIRSKNEKLAAGANTDTDILSVAITSGGFSEDDLVNQLMTFLAAGHETTASAMAWAVYLLCRHPEIQSRLREEVREQLPSISDGSSVTSQQIDNVHYLSAVCNEVLRLYPPVPMTLRQASKDTTIAGHFVPKDTTVFIPIWAINVNKAMWGDDAEEFNPERWMAPGQANSGGAESNYAMTTFLHGPRSCIGQAFAQAEFKCLLAAIVGKFELEATDLDTPLDIVGGVTQKPKGGVPVRLKEVPGW